MSYNGFNLRIENNNVANAIIVPGSYKIVKQKRLVDSWQDANGKWHYHYYPIPQVSISFSIKPRTEAQNNSISWLFLLRENITVYYYDDEINDYVTGTFKLMDPTLVHSYDGPNVYYAATEIKLVEY